MEGRNSRKGKAAHTRTSLARRGAGLGLISPHTYERGYPHTDEFGSLEPEPSRTREPDSYVYGPLKGPPAIHSLILTNSGNLWMAGRNVLKQEDEVEN
jgi:hypothetical protein